MAVDAVDIQVPADEGIDCYVVTIGENANNEAVRLVYQLRRAGLKVEKDYLKRQMRAQLRAANRLQAHFTVIIGDNELEKEIVNVRNKQKGEQEEVTYLNHKKTYMK